MPNGQKEEGPIILSDFSGGLNQAVSKFDVKENECLEAINVKFFNPDGCISPRPGRKWMDAPGDQLMSGSLATDIIGIYQWHMSSGQVVPMVATCSASSVEARIGYLSGDGTNGPIFNDLLHASDYMYYEWSNGTWSSPISTMSGAMFSADSVWFAPYENQIIMTWCPSGADTATVNALAPPFLWNGRSASAIALQISSEPLLGPEDDRSTGSADRQISTLVSLSAARCGTFQGYLFLMNTVEMELMSSDGSATGYFSAAWHPYRVRWNNPGASSVRAVDASAGGPAWNYSDFADFDPDDNYGITGYAEIGDKLLVFKKDKTYAVSWVGGEELFSFDKVSNTVGCIAPKSVVAAGQVAAWLAKDGVYLYRGQGAERVSDKIGNVIRSININRRLLACGAGWPELRQLWWSIPTNTCDRNNQGVIYDVTKGDLVNGAWSTGTLSVCNLLGYDKRVAEDSAVGLWGTGYDGWIYKYDSAIAYEASGTYNSSTKLSAGMPQSWKSGWSVFGAPDRVKRVKRIRTVADRRSGEMLSVAIRRNWETDGTPCASSERALSGRASYTGDLIYDKADLTCQGQALQIHYYTSAGSANPDPDTYPLSTHYWTIHEIGIDVDMMGTVFYGSV